MPSLKYSASIWFNNENQVRYAFPTETQIWSGGGTAPVYPLIDSENWKFEGVLPAGVPAESVTILQGDTVRCTVAGVEVRTAKWAIENDPSD